MRPKWHMVRAVYRRDKNGSTMRVRAVYTVYIAPVNEIHVSPPPQGHAGGATRPHGHRGAMRTGGQRPRREEPGQAQAQTPQARPTRRPGQL